MQVQGYQKKSVPELLCAIDACMSINQLFALVQHEGIVIQMKSQNSASNLPAQRLPEGPDDRSPLERLKEQVKQSIVGKGNPIPPSSAGGGSHPQSREMLIRAIDECRTINQLFALVQQKGIVIRMKSQNSASCLPMQPLEPIPTLTPLERLKEQVKQAVYDGG